MFASMILRRNKWHLKSLNGFVVSVERDHPKFYTSKFVSYHRPTSALSHSRSAGGGSELQLPVLLALTLTYFGRE